MKNVLLFIQDIHDNLGFPNAFATTLKATPSLITSTITWGSAARGATPTEGFHSPTFAAFVLQRIDRSLEGLSVKEVLESLTPVPFQERRPGDIVVYEMGYSMFYFKDNEGTEFVIGMTPVGIAALKLHFGPNIEGVVRAAL